MNLPKQKIGPDIASVSAVTLHQDGPPMRRLTDLPLNALSVRPDDTVGKALGLMEATGETACAVVRNNEAIGIVTWEAALLSDPNEVVSNTMRGLNAIIQIEQSIQSAAKAILDQKMDHAAVVEAGKFRGVVSSLALLGELQHSWDPMTNLPWSDRLREWGAARLNEDNEISIVFFDIDDFGKYNKLHGHKVGDDVIKTLASKLESVIDPEIDLLVRYAGDEFAIGTLRNRAGAERLLESLEPTTLSVASVPGTVDYSGGISGGKRSKNPSRTREEADVHVLQARTVEGARRAIAEEAGAGRGEGGRIDKEAGRRAADKLGAIRCSPGIRIADAVSAVGVAGAAGAIVRGGHGKWRPGLQRHDGVQLPPAD